MCVYVVVTPARNEIDSIRSTLDSVISQTVLPVYWIIVNDGSTDGTGDVLKIYSEVHSWIHVIDYTRETSDRRVGKNVVEIIESALQRTQGINWDFWVKLDGDIILPPSYFERLIKRFEENDKLGIASGQAYIPQEEGGFKLEWSAPHHVLGQARMYRRQCWEDIGSLAPRRLWDIIDVYKAQMHGWETRSFRDLKVIHMRPIDSRQQRQLRRRFDSGINHYTMGYHPIYFGARCLRAFWDDQPYFLAGTAMGLGFLYAFLARKRIYDQELKRFIRKKQRQMLGINRFIDYLRAESRSKEALEHSRSEA